MVLISDKKYACEACIKGHRSSACKHTDRPLFEIKKKGRPITQCEHCRELRKTKQVHVKCMCEAKDQLPDKEPVPVRKKGNLARVLASAAFPDGLPQVLGTSVATHSPESSSVDNPIRVCHCKDGADCHCSTAKKPSRSKPKDHVAPSLISPAVVTSVPMPITINALRPVLPRPSPPSSSSEHVTSHPHPHNYRFSHGSAFFSPYGRAYEEHHYSSEEGHTESLAENSLVQNQSTDLLAWSSDGSGSGHSFPRKAIPLCSFSESQDEFDSPEFPAGFRGSCTCGETCDCPTCLQHRGPIAWSSRETCPDPGSCNGCLRRPDIPPHHAPTPPTTPQDGRIPQPFESLEEWIKNIPIIPQPFDENSKPGSVDYSLFDLPRIVEPMPITLDSLPDVFHDSPTQCICVDDPRMRIGDFCMRCQRRCDDHDEPGEDQTDLIQSPFSGDRACCVSSGIPMLDVPPPRSRASSTSSVASDLSSLYPPSIEDTNGTLSSSLLAPSISRMRRLASDITSPIAGDGAAPTFALPFHSSAPDLAHPSSESYDPSYPGPISMLY